MSSDPIILHEIEVDHELANLFQLLKSFGMSDESIELFIDNGYGTESLKIIERHEVETLLLPPLLAGRTKCLEGLNNWRKSLGIRPIITPLSSIENRIVVPSTTSREEFTANFLINRSDKGKQIVSGYQEQHYLHKEHKKTITHIVVDEFKDKFGKLTNEELLNRARELSELFPTEEKFSWYQPSYSFDPSGKRIRLGKHFKGCLYDRNNNYKPIALAQQNKLKPGGSVVANSFDPENIVFSPDVEEQYKEIKLWLRYQEDEWDELKVKWEYSSPYRLFEVATVADCTRTNKLLSEYPVLRNPHGYTLIQLDFKLKYPGKEEQLFKYWPQFRQRIIPLFEADIGDVRGRSLLKHLLDGTVTEDCQDSVTFALLAYLLPSSVIFLKKGSKRWKLSFAECREAYFINVNNLSDIETDIQRLYDRCKQNDLPRRPFLIGIGPDFNELKEFLVYFEDVYYRFKTFLKALDVCFKIFKTYNLSFPREAAGPWNLIAHCRYGLDVDGDYYQSKINRLSTQLRFDNQQ